VGGPCDVEFNSLALLAYLAHHGEMSETVEMSVTEARDRFSDAVNRAAYGGEITYVTRGRARVHAAAIVPASLVEAYEELVDREDARIARERLADLDAGRAQTVSSAEVMAELGL
jgi:antitoxin (DNA-binding transcriptional repressor) of toxin-antitoxin stability system